jgi:hypothetical protein
MSQGLLPAIAEARATVSALFENSPPLLIEVRFPGCATSPDWYLCDEEEEFEKVLDSLAPGAELHVSSVRDLKNVRGAVCFRK